MSGEQKCQWPSKCDNQATTSYQDKARKVWKLCHEHRRQAKRNRA